MSILPIKCTTPTNHIPLIYIHCTTSHFYGTKFMQNSNRKTSLIVIILLFSKLILVFSNKNNWISGRLWLGINFSWSLLKVLRKLCRHTDKLSHTTHNAREIKLLQTVPWYFLFYNVTYCIYMNSLFISWLGRKSSTFIINCVRF